jgi:hypothetical protein
VKLPNRNSIGVTLILVVFIAAFLVGASECSAAEPVLQLEGGATVIRGPATGLGLTVKWPQAGPRSADFACSLFLIGQYEVKGVEQANQAIAHCQLVTHIKRLDFGIGPAFLQNTDAINGSHFNFALMLGYRVTDRLSIQWRHWSNAGTKSPNSGRDAVMVGWAF